jgi:fatty acid elongase 3
MAVAHGDAAASAPAKLAATQHIGGSGGVPPATTAVSHSSKATTPLMRNRTLTALMAAVAGVIYWSTTTVFSDWIDNWRFESRVGLHSPWVPTIAMAIYVTMIVLLPRWMRDRQPMNLGFMPFVHNFVLTVGSFVMTVGIAAELYDMWGRPDAAEYAICDPLHEHSSRRVYFWYFVFYLSKMYEFIDTLILCLRKKPLIFLHTYHHIITLWLCWVCLDDRLSIQWLCTIANTTIHVFMYYFYCCQSVGMDVWWKRHLTKLQITQFIADETGNVFWSYYAAYLGRTCSGSWFGFWFGMGVIASFLGLFINFYQGAYKKKRSGGKESGVDAPASVRKND